MPVPSAASLATGLTKVARPVTAPPFVRAATAVTELVQTQAIRVPQTVTSAMSRIPSTATAIEQGFAGRAALTARARALAAVESAFVNGTSVARSAAVTGLEATGTVGRVAQVVSRVPRVGNVLARYVPVVGRFAPGLGVASAILAIPAVFEFFAPSVHDWFLGGWKQTSAKQTVLPPGVGRSAVLYDVTAYVAEIYNGEPYPINGRADYAYSVMGPIGNIIPPYQAPASRSFAVLNDAGVAVGQGATLYGQTQYVIIRVVITRSDGVPETGAPWQPGGGSGGSSPNPINNAVTNLAHRPTAQEARNAALGAVAATIAAGKFQGVKPLNAADIAKNQQKKVGQPDLSTDPQNQTQPDLSACEGNSCGSANLKQSQDNAKSLEDMLQYLQTLGLGDIKKTVERIDTKMGVQIIDARGNKIGVGGMLKNAFDAVNRVGDYLRVDRITNLMTLAVTVHNAAMLTNQLEQTLAQAISNGLAVIGIKDKDNNPLNVNQILGKQVETIAKDIIGTQNYTTFTTEWKKASRIYQAGANLLNSVQSLRYSIMGALETIGGMNARIGNALLKFGVVGDSAYTWMNPQPNFDNQFMRSLETVQTVVSNVDSISSEILSAQDTVTQITTQKDELATALKSATEKPSPQHDPTKAKADTAKAVSGSPDINAIDLIKPGGI